MGGTAHPSCPHGAAWHTADGRIPARCATACPFAASSCANETDDGRRGAARNGPKGHSRRLYVSREERNCTEDRPSYGYLLTDEVHCLVRRLRSREQSGADNRGDIGFACGRTPRRR